MAEAPDLVRNETATMRQYDAQRGHFIHRAAEHQVRHHQRGVEREADEVRQVIIFHAALGQTLIRMGKDKAAKLLDGLQHLAELLRRQRRAFDRSRQLHRLETVLFHHALQLGNGGIRILHRQMRHAAQPRRVFRHHLRNAVVGEFCRSEAGIC